MYSMDNKIIFHKVREARAPVAGELIRNSDTGRYINLVLSVVEQPNDKVEVHSVRFADTNFGDLIIMRGMRVKPFIWSYKWDIVKGYRQVEETFENEKKDHLTILKDKDLYYKESK